MIKTALIVIFISSTNINKVPEISLASIYESKEECYKELDNIKKNLSAIEIESKVNTRIVKMESREAYQEGYIYFSCSSKG